MIEFCTLKRMTFFILLLIGLCICILALENTFTPEEPRLTTTPFILNTSKDYLCWEHESYQMKQACQVCSRLEMTSGQKACLKTGFKEIIVCSKSKETYRSCNPLAEEKAFWIFEGGSLGFAVVSIITVILRQRKLDRQAFERIQKQIAAGI